MRQPALPEWGRLPADSRQFHLPLPAQVRGQVLQREAQALRGRPLLRARDLPRGAGGAAGRKGDDLQVPVSPLVDG